MVTSTSGPKMVLVEQFEQSRCFWRLSPLTIYEIHVYEKHVQISKIEFEISEIMLE